MDSWTNGLIWYSRSDILARSYLYFFYSMVNRRFLAVVVYATVRWLTMGSVDQVVVDELSFAKEYLNPGRY